MSDAYADQQLRRRPNAGANCAPARGGRPPFVPRRRVGDVVREGKGRPEKQTPRSKMQDLWDDATASMSPDD
eukprot:4125986-Prymnesium_polylepis.1